MTFVHAGLLGAGLACIAIPILIHLLLRRRRRPIVWGAMRFLMEAYRRQRRRMKLQQWLLLAARCLVILLLALALGRPLLDSAGLLGGSGGRDVYFVIDTGLASSVRDPETGRTALERLKEQAGAMMSGLGPGDRVGLIEASSPARGIVAPPSSDIGAVRSLMMDLSSTGAASDFGGAFETIAGAMEREPAGRRTVVALFSDFLLGSADPARALPSPFDGSREVSVLAMRPAPIAPTNVQITAVEPLSAVMLTGSGGVSRGERVQVMLRRSGPGTSEAGATTVRLRSGAAERDQAAPPTSGVVRWQPGQTEATLALQVDAVTGGAGESADTVLSAEIDRDPIVDDNRFLRPIEVREALRVGVVARRRFGGALRADRMAPHDWLRLALNPTGRDPIDLVDIDPASVDAPTLAGVDVAIVPSPDLLSDDAWGRLGAFVRAGGLMLVSPAPDASVQLWPDQLSRSLGLDWRIAREPVGVGDEPLRLADEQPDSPVLTMLRAELDELVKPVGITRLLPVESIGGGTHVMLSLADGRPWIIAAAPGGGAEETEQGVSQRGLVVYMASAPTLAWTDLPARPLMVPLVQEIVRRGYGRSVGSWSAIAGRATEAPARTARLVAVGDGAAGREISVGSDWRSAVPIRHAGLWRAVDQAGRSRGYVAVNADAQAGRVTPQPALAIAAWLNGALATVGGGGETVEARSGVEWIDEQNPAVALATNIGGSPLSYPLLLAALVIAALETMMARWFSYAKRESGDGHTGAARAVAA